MLNGVMLVINFLRLLIQLVKSIGVIVIFCSRALNRACSLRVSIVSIISPPPRAPPRRPSLHFVKGTVPWRRRCVCAPFSLEPKTGSWWVVVRNNRSAVLLAIKRTTQAQRTRAEREFVAHDALSYVLQQCPSVCR